jgi:hypothetical protein
MAHNLEGDDYLDLWKYFEDRADNVKGAMFTSVTWALGFSAAIFGFIFSTLLDLKEMTLFDLKPKSPEAVFLASVVGYLLCLYSVIMVRESRKHILRNWERAERCKRNVYGMTHIVPDLDKDPTAESWLNLVWNRVLVIIFAFTAGFCALVALALAKLVIW